MMFMVIVVLLLLGLCFGSFINALVWRIHMQNKTQSGGRKSAAASSRSAARYSITRGRSMCIHCKHELAARDLIPLFSWLLLHGRCRYCRKPISWQYPLIEAVTAALFIFSYLFWPYETTGFNGLFTFSVWLVILVGLIALLVYDIRWMLLPNRIMNFLYGAVALYALGRIAEQGYSFEAFRDVVLSTLIGGGIFYVLFQLSKGSWIGGGDVKLGFILGALVGLPYLALLTLFIASLLGSLYSLPLLVTKRATRTSRIPFGPFLIAAGIIVLFFGITISDAYSRLILEAAI